MLVTIMNNVERQRKWSTIKTVGVAILIRKVLFIFLLEILCSVLNINDSTPVSTGAYQTTTFNHIPNTLLL